MELCQVEAQCGGCGLLSASEAEETELKANTVALALADWWTQPIERSSFSTERIHYRNRIRLRVTNGEVGFFNPAKEIYGCAVLIPNLGLAVDKLRAISSSNPSFLKNVENLEIRISPVDSKLGLWVNGDADLTALSKVLGPDWLLGSPSSPQMVGLTYEVHPGLEYNVPLSSFVQVNAAVSQKIALHVVELAIECGSRTFCDVFAGAGHFALALANEGLSGAALESSSAAIASLAAHELSSQIKATSCDAYASEHLQGQYDLVIVNPPRAGLKQTATEIAGMAQKNLIYISCNPTSLAADTEILVNEGLALTNVRAFNMFPGTRHVETVVSFTRN